MSKFLNLIRPVNLLIIAVTMYGVGFYFNQLLIHAGYESALYSLNFFILVISTVIIAAGGNIINDYFDVKADRINKPQRLVVGKFIKRRNAILLHWIFNLIAFGMAIYLSYQLSSFWYLFIHLLSINLLWYYSVQLKRTTVVGNLVIAFLTALVPVLVGIFFLQIIDWEEINYLFPFVKSNLKFFPIYTGIGLGTFAFFLNWTRELIKDIEDLEGDKELKARTFPIVNGVKNAKKLAYFILFIPILLTLLFIVFKQKSIIEDFKSYLPVLLAGILIIIVYFMIYFAKTTSQFRNIHLLLKLAMIIGITLPVYWSFLILLK